MSNAGVTGLSNYVKLISIILDDPQQKRKFNAREATLLLAAMARVSLKRNKWMIPLTSVFTKEKIVGSKQEINLSNFALVLKSIGVLGFRPH